MSKNTQPAIEAAKEAPAKLQERLRDHQRANYLSCSPASIALCNEAADALDAAEARISALSTERDRALEEAAKIIDPEAFNSSGWRPEQARNTALEKARAILKMPSEEAAKVDLADPDESAEIAMALVNSLPHMPTMPDRYRLTRKIALALKSSPPPVAEDVVERAAKALWEHRAKEIRSTGGFAQPWETLAPIFRVEAQIEAEVVIAAANLLRADKDPV